MSVNDHNETPAGAGKQTGSHGEACGGTATELVETLDALHRRYLETRDEHYVLLAIGLCPETPPRWATGVCARLAADSRYRGASRVRSKKVEDADRRLLDYLVDKLVSGRALPSAARMLMAEVLDSDAPVRNHDPLREGRRSTDPLRPARNLRDAYALALREIESGDLATEIDENEERGRLALSRWLRVEGPDGDREGGILLRVAPRPTGRNLVRMVKALILEQRDAGLARLVNVGMTEPKPTAGATAQEAPVETPLQATMKLVSASPTSPTVNRQA